MMPLRLRRSPQPAPSIESSRIFNRLARRQPRSPAVSGALPGCFRPVSTPFRERRFGTGATLAFPHQHVAGISGAAVCCPAGGSAKSAVGSVAWATLATPEAASMAGTEASTGHQRTAHMASTERAASTRVDLPAASARPWRESSRPHRIALPGATPGYRADKIAPLRRPANFSPLRRAAGRRQAAPPRLETVRKALI